MSSKEALTGAQLLERIKAKGFEVELAFKVRPANLDESQLKMIAENRQLLIDALVDANITARVPKQPDEGKDEVLF